MSDDYLKYELLGKLQEAEDRIGELRDAANWLIGHLPWFVPASVKSDLIGKSNQFHASAMGEVGDFRQQVNLTGEPWKLREAADHWIDEVATVVAEVGPLIKSGKLTVDNDGLFSGLGATAYRNNVITSQQDAVAAIAEYFPDLSSVLNSTADAVNAYNRSQIVIMVAFIVAIVCAIGAIVSSETGVGAVLGLIGVIGAAAVMVAEGLSAEADLKEAMGSIADDLRALNISKADLEGDTWPQAVFA